MNFKNFLVFICLIISFQNFAQYGIKDTFNLFMHKYNNGDLTLEQLDDSLTNFFNSLPSDEPTSHYEKVFQRGMAFRKDRIYFDVYGNEIRDGYRGSLDTYLQTPTCENRDKANWKFHFDPSPITTKPSVCSATGGHAAGIMTAVYMNPSLKNIIVAGAGASGIWFSDNGGVNWENVTDHFRIPSLGINKIMDISKPSEPEGKYLIAITGKDRFHDSYGVGVLKSDDYGQSWTRHSIPEPEGYMEYIVDITKPIGETNTLFLCTHKHVYYSLDRGSTWNETPSQPSINLSRERYQSISASDLVTGQVIVTSTLLYGADEAHAWRMSFTPALGAWSDLTHSNLLSSINDLRSVDLDDTELFEESCNLLTPVDGFSLDEDDEIDEYFPLQFELYGGLWHIKSMPVIYFSELYGYGAHDRGQQSLVYDLGNVDVQGNVFASFDALLPLGCKIEINMDGVFIGDVSGTGVYQSYTINETIEESELRAKELEIKFIYGLSYDIYDPVPIYMDNLYLNLNRVSNLRPRTISISNSNDSEAYFLINTINELTLVQDVTCVKTSDFATSTEIINEQKNANLGVKHNFTVAYGAEDHLYYGGHDFRAYDPFLDEFSSVCTQHADVRSIQVVDNIAGQDEIIVGDDGGISYSDDSGVNWTSLNGEYLPITQFYGFGLNENDHLSIVGGSQDNGTFLGQHPTWEHIRAGDGGHSGFIPLADYADWHYLQSNAVIEVKELVDDGELVDLSTVYSFNTGAAGINWYLNEPIEIDPIEGLTLFSGHKKTGGYSSAVVVKHDIDSEDGDYTIHEFLGATQETGAIEIAKANTNWIYVSTGENRNDLTFEKLFLSKDYGVTYDDLTLLSTTSVTEELGNPVIGKTLNQVLDRKNINVIKTHPTDPEKVWIGLSGINVRDGEPFSGELRVLYSNDGGLVWHDFSLGLPPFPINDLIYQENTNNRLFAATDVGVFYREEGMDEWVCFQQGMPATFTTDLEIDDCKQELFAATYGRGIWKTSIDLPDSDPVIIDSDLIWGGTQSFEHNIIIESGNSLTLNGTIEMAGTKHIIVKQGAELILDGGVLTNSCNSFWGGVQVEGDFSAIQNDDNQGKITMVNDALIENAEVGVSLWESGNWSSTGGIIIASNSTFKNNRKDVEFMKFQNTNFDGEPIPNESYFVDATFTWDDDFRGEFPLGHVTAYKVDGIRFKGCTFNDNRTTPESRYYLDYGRNNSGIYSVDAQYFVLPLCTDYISGCTGSIEDDPDWIPTTFENLDFGVYASNISTEQNITVDRAIFENNLYGIQIVNVNNPVITRNRFDVNSDPTNNFTATTQRGIHAVRSKGLTIEENEFTHLSGLNPVQGIICSDLGESDERIYNNFFRELDYGIITQGKNRLYDPTGVEDGLKGLEFTCDENISNKQDHRVLGNLWGGAPDPTFGVKSNNGLPSMASGNVLSTETPLEVGEHYNNISTNLVRYYYYNLSPVEDPVDVAGPFMKVPTEFVNTCPSELEDNSNQDHSSGFITTTQNNFITYNADLESKKIAYHSLVNGGDTGELMDEIDGLTRDNRDTLHALLLSYSPYLTEDIVRATVNHPITKYPHAWAYELVEENIEVAYQPGFMDFLATKTYPLPQFMIEDIQALLDSNASTDMLTKQLEIADLEAKKAYTANLLLQSLKNDTLGTKIDSIRYWIDAKDDVLEQTRIIDTYIQNEDFVEAETSLSDLTLNIQNYPIHLHDELNDFIDFKNILLANLIANIPLDSISETDYNEILLIAENGVGIGSYQAKEFLCFFFDQCYDYPVTLVGQGFMAPIQSNEEIETVNKERQFKVYPNPAGTWLAIELPSEDSNLEITVIDLTGRLVYEKSIMGSGGTSRSSLIEIWDTNLIGEGNYLITITNADGSINYGTQMVTIHR